VTKGVSDPRGEGEAAREGGRRGARAEGSYRVDEQLPPELQMLADAAIRVSEERRRQRASDVVEDEAS